MTARPGDDGPAALSPVFSTARSTGPADLGAPAISTGSASGRPADSGPPAVSPGSDLRAPASSIGPADSGPRTVAAPGSLIGIGLDTVDIARFATLLGRRATLRARLFTEHERAYADGLANPVPSLAARFAAKEAVMKSLGVGLGALDWWDVEVLRRRSGAPVLTITGRAAALAALRGVRGWQLSLTHTQSVASAVVAALA